MIPRTLHDLVSTIDLFHQDKKSKWVWDDEVRNLHRSMRNLRKYFQIETIASSGDEYYIFAPILRIFEHFREFARLHPFSSFIEEEDPSFHLFKSFYDRESLFHSDIFGIGMWDGFYTFYMSKFLYTFFVFFYGFWEMFEAVSDSKYRDHKTYSIEKSKLSKNFLTRGAFFIQSARVPP